MTQNKGNGNKGGTMKKERLISEFNRYQEALGRLAEARLYGWTTKPNIWAKKIVRKGNPLRNLDETLRNELEAACRI